MEQKLEKDYIRKVLIKRLDVTAIHYLGAYDLNINELPFLMDEQTLLLV